MSKKTKPKPFFVRLENDDYFDEVRVLGKDLPIMRVVTRYRFKTSGMSGDVWRFSTMWQFYQTDGSWKDYDGPYGDIETACAAAYPGIFKSHSDLHGRACGAIDFYRKGLVVYRSTYDDLFIPLLQALAHLPWALVTAGFPIRKEEEARGLCFQPGCAEPAISIYRLRKRGCRRCGHVKDAGTMFGKRPYARRFCRKHLRRGTSCRDDQDVMYEVIEGPGPDEAEGWKEHESKARFGGVIDLTGEVGS